jgi:hypothetical protein
MGGLFSSPKMPDTSKQEALMKQQQERLDKQERERMEQLQARRRARGGSGMAALLSPERSDAEQGLQSTLGPK